MEACTNDEAALRDLVRQSQLAGAVRRAVLLHPDQLPHALSKPHHCRLARQAVDVLAAADHAQVFELSRGRLAIVLRGACEIELAQARCALAHLLADQSADPAPDLCGLLTIYDLPDQAAWLLDALCDPALKAGEPILGRVPLDIKLLARLEASLAQADLSHFVRSRAVVDLSQPLNRAGHAVLGCVAWEEHEFAIDELAASLCPGRNLGGNAWLFGRLTRTLDRRMLALLTAAPFERGGGAFAIHLNVASILSAEFLRFDEKLPVALRGQVILTLRPADILSDAACFVFARDFGRARRYRFALEAGAPGLLTFFDAAAAGMDYVKRAAFEPLLSNIDSVLTGLDTPADVDWAVRHRYRFGQGQAFTH